MTDESCCKRDLLGTTAFGSDAHALGVAGFAALWNGAQPAIFELCVDESVIDQLQRAGRLELAKDRTLLGIHGLTVRNTVHRIQRSNGAVVHTWCALDAIGIPAALRINATAVTVCPTCKTSLRVELTQGVPACDPNYRLWLPNEDCRNLVEDFCRHANLYCNAEHLSAAEKSAGGRAIDVAETAAIGRTMWADAAVVLRD